MLLDQQWHGYRRGHQLLASTIELSPRDQDLVDKLSDASGSPRPGERFDPYLTIYPLPSGKFHVVARTWQDLNAPRSGTVFTRSLLIPSDIWLAKVALRPIFAALGEREITNERTALPAIDRHWPAIDGANLAELTEVLFLERTAAVAGFGFSQTETIAGRLLEAIWPSRRASMAVCTYALGPRSLGDRDFDLIFAPESARSRFAKWDGRRISASTAPAAARHAWTSQIVDRIFRDAEPSLDELDEIGAFDSDARGDGSALRLALVWGDLKKNAETSPKALLGMLDVLSSLGRRPWDLKYFPALVVRSLNSTANAPTPEGWQFLQLLVRKLGSDIPLGVIRNVFKATRELAHTAPELITACIERDPMQTVPHVLRPAVANGISRLERADFENFLRSSTPAMTLSLMAENPAFTLAAARSMSTKVNAALATALSELAAEDQRSARRISTGVARGALSSSIAPLLRTIFENSPRGNYALLAKDVLENGGSSRDEVLAVLIETARSLSAQDDLRQLALKAPKSDEGDTLLFNLTRDRADTAWLVDALSSSPSRLSPLLLRLMDRWSDSDLKDVLSAGRNKDAFLEAAIEDLSHSTAALIRLLKILPANPPTSVAVLRQAGARLSETDRVVVSMAVLDQLFSLEPNSISDLLAPLLASAEPGRIITAATSTAFAGKQVGQNIAAISKSAAAMRFVPRVDLITAKLVERRSGGYGREGYDGWASLLRQARKHAPEALVRSADPSLDYSLARSGEPAGAVVAAAFPIVHARLAKKNNLPEIPFNLLTAVFYASIALFTDWDRTKAARHGVVDAFLRSNWEPAELLRAGIDARIPNKILGYLVTKHGGREYLRKIEKSAASYPEPTRSALKAAISEFNSRIAA